MSKLRPENVAVYSIFLYILSIFANVEEMPHNDRSKVQRYCYDIEGTMLSTSHT